MGRDLDRRQGMPGVRWMVGEGLALKAEGVLGQEQQRDDLRQTTSVPVATANLQITGSL